MWERPKSLLTRELTTGKSIGKQALSSIAEESVNDSSNAGSSL